MRINRVMTPSIVGRVNRLTRTLILLFGLPVLLVTITTAVFAYHYATATERMNTIAAMKPVIGTEIPEAVWRVVSGRATMAESGVWEMMGEVEDTLARITGEVPEDRRLELTIAGRTMETMHQYVSQIETNVENGAPVVENEGILKEIRGVADLVNSMLNDSITRALEANGRDASHMIRVAVIWGVVEIILLCFGLFKADQYRKRTEKFIREPIERLEKVTARLAGGDMSARLPLTQVEELWKLTGEVNIMADNLEYMMQQRVRGERNLKKAEMRTLQAQINPHFLYNTLDTIVWKAEAGNQEEVIHLIRSLSDFFRISLSSGADWIPISQEKKHIAGYLSIQKTRYSDILDYEIDIPDEIGRYYMLKLLLQPLVENALYHGIKFRRGGGKIRVSGIKQGDELLFTVKDTGKGMSPETLAELRERITRDAPAVGAGTSGFGLVNVNLRLRLYYNEPEGLRISSGPEGTTVSFRVPCRSEEEIRNEQEIQDGLSLPR